MSKFNPSEVAHQRLATFERLQLEEHLREQVTPESLAGPTARVVHIVLHPRDYGKLQDYAQKVSVEVGRLIGLDELCTAVVRQVIY